MTLRIVYDASGRGRVLYRCRVCGNRWEVTLLGLIRGTEKAPPSECLAKRSAA